MEEGAERGFWGVCGVGPRSLPCRRGGCGYEDENHHFKLIACFTLTIYCSIVATLVVLFIVLIVAAFLVLSSGVLLFLFFFSTVLILVATAVVVVHASWVSGAQVCHVALRNPEAGSRGPRLAARPAYRAPAMGAALSGVYCFRWTFLTDSHGPSLFEIDPDVPGGAQVAGLRLGSKPARNKEGSIRTT